jgi:Na+-driven multidrug efflux pump
MTISVENVVSKKSIIIGMLMMLGIRLATIFLLPFPFNLPLYLIISIIVLAKY